MQSISDQVQNQRSAPSPGISLQLQCEFYKRAQQLLSSNPAVGKAPANEILHLPTSPAIFRCERSKICCLVSFTPQRISSHLHRCNLITQVLQNYTATFPSEQGALRTNQPSQPSLQQLAAGEK